MSLILSRLFIWPQKKRENPAFRSSHTLRLWHAQTFKNEQRTETHADEFIQLSQYPVVRIQQDTGHL